MPETTWMAHPADEATRLVGLQALMVLDSAPEPLFDTLVQMASDTCGAPIALLSLVDTQRQWFKANVGLPDMQETPRDISFCAHAVHGDGLFEVPDAARDERFTDNPLVTSTPDVRFYAGAPLVLPRGERIGTLCVMDHHARQLNPAQREKLQSLAALATQALVMRAELIEKTLKVRSKYEIALAESEAQYRLLIEQQSEVVSLAQPDGKLIYVNAAYARQFGLPPLQMIGRNLFDFVAEIDRSAVRTQIALVLTDGVTRTDENRVRSADGTERWLAWTNALQHDDRGTRLLHSVGRDVTERKQLEQRVADNERFVRYVTDSVPVRIAYVDHQRRYRFVNRAHCESLGLERDTILGHTRAELLGGERHGGAAIAQRVQAALSGEHQRFEFEDLVGGVLRQIDAQLLPDSGDSGDVRGFFLIGVDITERATAERSLRELTAIIENTSDYVVQTDRQGTVDYMNPSVRRVLGLHPDAPLPKGRFSDFYTSETNRTLQETALPMVQANGVWIGESKAYAKDRREVPVSHMVIAHRDEQGCVARFSSVMRDISASVEAEAKAGRQTAILRSIAEAIPSSVAVFSADGRYQFVNRTFERWCGLQREQIIGHTPNAVLGQREFERQQPWFERALAGEAVGFELDYPGHRPAHQRIDYVPLRSTSDAAGGCVMVAQDVTQQRIEQRRLLDLSQRDGLTGLLNRTGFEETLQRQLQHAPDASVAVLYIDLDHFKPVNDRHGHPTGDRVLQLFAKRLKNVVRPTDGLARLGGDEFVIALFGMRELSNAQSVADKVLRAAKTPFHLGELLLQLGASVGVAFAQGPVIDPGRLIQQADAQLLKAKAAGKGRRA